MTLPRMLLLMVLALSSTACLNVFKDLFNSPTSPSDSDEVRSYLGTWSGPAGTPAAQSCSALQWKITAQEGSQASGEFSATCGDGAALTGTLTATHGETTIPWAATGTATKDGASCPFSVTGAGTFQGTSNILVSYSGTSCLGPFSGSETIKR